MKIKHLIISGPQSDYNKEVARKILQSEDYKFSTRLSRKITAIELAKKGDLPYLRLILIEGCTDQSRIAFLAKEIGLFTDAAIIFTCDKRCLSLDKEDRFNVIELG